MIPTNKQKVAIFVDDFSATVATGKIIGTDPYTDLAVVRVKVPASVLHPLRFAGSAVEVGVGQRAYHLTRQGSDVRVIWTRPGHLQIARVTPYLRRVRLFGELVRRA